MLIDLSTFADTSISLGSSNSRIRGELTFSYVPDLAGGTYVSQDDTVIFSCHERCLFKGLVKEVKHSLSSEKVEVVVQSADNFLNCQKWEAVQKWYNKVDQTCETYPIDTTLQEFITSEFVNDVATWLSSITVASTIQDLIIPEVNTDRRGFLETLEAVLAPFPFITWRIDFNTNPVLFPIGTMLIFDLRDGTGTSFALPVGNTNGIVKSADVRETIAECAEKVYAYARGRFVERLEILTPNWSPSEEEITIENQYLQPPRTETDKTSLPQGHEFIQEFEMWVENAQMYPPEGVGVFSDNWRLWHGADFKINGETGEIDWLKPDDGNDWWWVNRETGQIASSVSQTVLGNLEGSFWRRPVMYENELLQENVRLRANYKRIGDRPYRNYKTSLPIYDLRLLPVEENEIDPGSGFETGDTITLFRKAPNSLDIYIPKVAAQRFVLETSADVTLDFRGVIEGPSDLMREQWDQLFFDYNKLLGNIPQDQPAPDTTLPKVKANMLWPTATTVDEVLRWFTKAQSDASFAEGTKCCVMGSRQLIAIPEWADQPNGFGGTTIDAIQEATRPLRFGWATWAVLAHYTSWEELYIERTNTIGKGRTARAVAHSSFAYSNRAAVGLITDEEIVYDNTETYLTDLADMMQEFYGTPDWDGKVEVMLTLNADTKWECPYNIGDTCSLSGAVSAGLASFLGVIRSINFDNIDQGYVSLDFGRRPPKLDPFLARPDIPVDIEGDSQTGPGTAGLAVLGG